MSLLVTNLRQNKRGNAKYRPEAQIPKSETLHDVLGIKEKYLPPVDRYFFTHS